MNTEANILTYLPKHLFWDVECKTLSIEKDKDLIIPRALYFTNKNTFSKDISRLENLYSEEEILTSLNKTQTIISNEVCQLVNKKYASAV